MVKELAKQLFLAGVKIQKDMYKPDGLVKLIYQGSTTFCHNYKEIAFFIKESSGMVIPDGQEQEVLDFLQKHELEWVLETVKFGLPGGKIWGLKKL